MPAATTANPTAAASALPPVWPIGGRVPQSRAKSHARSHGTSAMRIEPRWIVLEVAGQAIAATSCALWLDGLDGQPALFIPKGDLKGSALRPSNRGRACPRLGLLRYWSLSVAGLTIDRAARSCEQPRPDIERLRDHIVFDIEQLNRVREVKSWLN